MGIIATNTSVQIGKLKERGLNLDLGEEKIKEVLLDIGYYRLGFYWNPFEIDGEHNFRPEAKFSDALALYYLDVDLRNLLMRLLNRIEINFRTKVVYYVSNKYKKSPTWFIDPEVMTHDFIGAISQHYNEEFIKNNKTIKLHHRNNINDKYAPAWKTLEFFTFGTILKIYKSVKNNEIKERIAGLYDVRNVKKFENLMNTVVHIRNICAHGGVLFDLQLPKGISAHPAITFNNNNRHSLDSAIKVVHYILSQISSNRAADLDNEIKMLFDKCAANQSLKSIIEDKIGYSF
ncbi:MULTISPECIES: Abi family protein [unclassified Carboxylicivirga]|uniref:Abi family protein n=1 Tax=Carboxylicivirga TaxID=1628153 RepID=UPI003D334D07